MKKKIVLLLTLISINFFLNGTSVFASDTENNMLLGADQSRLGVLFQNGNVAYRLDLTIADLMDQVSIELKNHPELSEQLEDVTGNNPIENFPLWFAKLRELASQSEDAAKAMGKLIVQGYDQKGMAISGGVVVKGLFQKMKRLRSSGIYANYMNDPEGESFSRYFALKKRSPFLSSLFTVSKANYYKKELIKEKRKFYQEYISLLMTQEQKDAVVYKTKERNIDIVDESDSSKRESVKIRIKNGSDYSKKEILEHRKTQKWFNAIFSREDKKDILKFIQINLQLQTQTATLPVGKLHGESHLLLTPSFLYVHQKEIEPLLKAYNYQRLILSGDNEQLNRLSNWIESNAEKISKAGILFSSNPASFDDILSHYEALISAFPDRPWEPETVMFDKRGEPVLLVGVPLKTLYKIGKNVKKVIQIENLASIGAAIAVTSATSNPITGAYAASAVRNSFKVLRAGKPLYNAIIPTLIEGTLYAIPASGFVGGEISRAVLLGGSQGLARSLMTGQDPVIGTLVGAGIQLAETALPARVVNYTVGGWDAHSAATNAVIEVVQSAAKGALQGALTQEISQDASMTVGEAARKSALLNAGGTALVIGILGPRMTPLSVSEAQLLQEKDYQATYHYFGDYSKDEYLRTPQRWGKFSLRQFFNGGDRGFFYGNGANIPEGKENTNLTLHEQSHNQQSLERGAVRFILDYLLEAYKNGTKGAQIGGGNKFEHYGYLTP